MSVGAYLRVVADNFNKAALHRKQETDDLRREIATKEKALHDQIDSIENEMRILSRALNGEGDPTSKSHMTAEIGRLSQAIKDVERQFNEQKAVLNDQIRQMEQQINEFNQLSSQFLNRASQS